MSNSSHTIYYGTTLSQDYAPILSRHQSKSLPITNSLEENNLMSNTSHCLLYMGPL